MSGNHLNDLSKIYLDKVYKNNTETAEADKSRWEDLGGPTPDNYRSDDNSAKLKEDYESKKKSEVLAAFKRGLPKTVKDGDAKALFDAVRTGMKQKKKGVEESYDLWEIAPKSDPRGLRDNYVKRKIFNIGDLVENLNTGLVGRIMRRGTNYLICVTEQDNMFKSWIHDVTEAVRPANKTGRYGVPSPQREVGTDAYREYAQSMVPGQETIRNFINKYKAKR